MQFDNSARTADMPLKGVEFTPEEQHQAAQAAASMYTTSIDTINNGMDVLGHFIVYLDKVSVFTSSNSDSEANRKETITKAAIFYRALTLARMTFFVSEKTKDTLVNV